MLFGFMEGDERTEFLMKWAVDAEKSRSEREASGELQRALDEGAVKTREYLEKLRLGWRDERVKMMYDRYTG